ncbi:chemotaxis protein CheB [Luteimonas sp. MJ246]|uniref:chemotaxis protein CheB n=1 Tax=Luteimonas sp. MJ174 TaxID=3129237 RepID=UPI0031BB9632
MADQGATPVRVLLLARAGEARQRLESAIGEAGAELVAAVDPGEGDPSATIALAPAAVLVALEPAIEESLEGYEALLSDPAVLVMFDEADVAAQRDGWDAARWVRHLAAKLNGHQDVLPPGAGSDDAVHPAPGRLPEQSFDPASVDIDALADTALDLAADVPRAEGFESPPPALDEPGADGADADAATGLDADAAADRATDDDGDAAGELSVSGLVSAEDMDWSASSDSYAASLAEDPALAELLASASASTAAADDDAANGSTGEAMDLADDFDVDFDATTAGDMPGDDADATVDARSGADAAAPAVDPLSLGDGLSLADDDAPIALPARGGDAVDLEALASRLDGLSLADPDSYGHGVLRGAVLVEAGLGGPDAVRQLLGGLGAEFARAVLVRLQLDGGRYERLVQQMQRATALPVKLADAGAMAEPGTVYFLPPDIAVARDRARLVFATVSDGALDHYDSLAAGDSALVFLSGAAVDRVDAAMALAADGALVLAQAPASCYDGLAVDALVARGAQAAEPGELAQSLLDRWP